MVKCVHIWRSPNRRSHHEDRVGQSVRKLQEQVNVGKKRIQNTLNPITYITYISAIKCSFLYNYNRLCNKQHTLKREDHSVFTTWPLTFANNSCYENEKPDLIIWVSSSCTYDWTHKHMAIFLKVVYLKKKKKMKLSHILFILHMHEWNYCICTVTQMLLFCLCRPQQSMTKEKKKKTLRMWLKLKLVKGITRVLHKPFANYSHF